MLKQKLSRPMIVVIGLCVVFASGQTAAKHAAGQRIIRSLDAGWRFSPDDKRGNEDTNVDDSTWQAVNLPHTWNDKDAVDETPGYRRGPSWYRRELQLNRDLANKRLYLYFEGANQVAEVYVNTHLVGKHIGGYTAFSFDITDAVTIGKPNFIAVRVDNSFNADIPPLTADFNMYGGIYRDVWLIAASDVHFNMDDLASPGIQISTPGVSENGGRVNIRATVTNSSGIDRPIRFDCRVIDAAGRQVALASANAGVAAGKDAVFDLTTPAVTRPHLWSPDGPYLYTVENTITENGKTIDILKQPLGFRWYRFDPDAGFFLNGKHLNLRGTNRHQDYKGLGNALPDRLHVRDMQLIKDAGFNFVRLAHYPQDPAVLEAADRLGLLIWEEIPIVNYITVSQAFSDNSMTMLKEMVRQHRNHPSVILWGYMNEIYLRVPKGADELYPATVKLARDLDAAARLEDPTRMTTMAMHANDIYNAKGLADVPQVVGWNIYSGWYSGDIDGFGEFIDNQHGRFPKRPLIISEYGANGDRRLHSAEPRRFDSTTEYQRAFHESYLAQIDARPYIAGSALWSEFDFGSELRGETIPHVNQKGMFTADRQPKDVHFFYKASLSGHPVIHIAVSDRKFFAGPPAAAQEVAVYTNAAEIELLNNGVSFGKKRVVGHTAVWKVTLKNGVNQLLARAVREGIVIADAARVSFKAITAASPEIAINVGSNADFIDADNVVWIADQAYRSGAWGFVGDRAKRIYSDTPDRDVIGTDADPLYQTMVEGLAAYKIDVPAGDYDVELLFAETKFDVPGRRVFNVTINGSGVLAGLDLAKQTGRSRAFSKRVRIHTGGGISVEFSRVAGEPVLSGIRVVRADTQ